jgi:hypothetical protein
VPAERRWKQKRQRGQEGQEVLVGHFALLALFAFFASTFILPSPEGLHGREHFSL